MAYIYVIVVSIIVIVVSVTNSISNSNRSIEKSKQEIVSTKAKTSEYQKETNRYHDCMVTEIAKMRLDKNHDYKAGSCDPDYLKTEQEIKNRMQELKKSR
jgi:hypothetical protein